MGVGYRMSALCGHMLVKHTCTGEGSEVPYQRLADECGDVALEIGLNIPCKNVAVSVLQHGRAETLRAYLG